MQRDSFTQIRNTHEWQFGASCVPATHLQHTATLDNTLQHGLVSSSDPESRYASQALFLASLGFCVHYCIDRDTVQPHSLWRWSVQSAQKFQIATCPVVRCRRSVKPHPIVNLHIYTYISIYVYTYFYTYINLHIYLSI